MPSGIHNVPQAQLPTDFQGLIKLALKPRQVRVYLLSLFATHLLLALTLVSPLVVVSPIFILASCLSYACGIVPLLIARKRLLSTTSKLPTALANDRAAQLVALLQDPAAWAQISLHSAAFATLAALHCLTITALRGSSADWAPQTWVASHNAYYVNERFLFLVGQAALLGALYAIFARTWPSSSTTALIPFQSAVGSDGAETLKERVTNAVSRRVLRAAANGALGGLGLFVGYIVLRRTLWRSLLAIVGHRGIVRRLLVPSFRPAFSHLEVGWRATLFGAAATASIEAAYVLLEVYLSHPVTPVSTLAKQPNVVLANGTADPSLFFSNHAFNELSRLAAQDGGFRQGLFKDVNGDRSAWAELSAACLKVIEEERRNITARGIVPQPRSTTATTVAPTPPPATSSTPDAAKANVWQALAQGSVTGEQPKSSPTVATQASPPRPRRSLITVASGLAQTAWRLLPPDARHALCPPRLRYYLSESSPAAKATSVAGRDSARLLWALSSLKDLLQHSLDEDPYGSAQRDIKKVLRAMLGLSEELRSFRTDLEKEAAILDDKLAREVQAARSTSSATAEETRTDRDQQKQVSRELSGAWDLAGAAQVESALKAAIRAIVETFGSYKMHLEPEFEAQLSKCLLGSDEMDSGRRG